MTGIILVWFPMEGDGHPTIDTGCGTDLDPHFSRIPIVRWMTINLKNHVLTGAHMNMNNIWE